MAELADAQDLGSCGEIRVGSTPTTRTRGIPQQSAAIPCGIAALFYPLLFSNQGFSVSSARSTTICRSPQKRAAAFAATLFLSVAF